jgi:hypothetical protein
VVSRGVGVEGREDGPERDAQRDVADQQLEVVPEDVLDQHWRAAEEPGVEPAGCGHLMRVYAKCMTGLEDVWISRMDTALHLENPGQME